MLTHYKNPNNLNTDSGAFAYDLTNSKCSIGNGYYTSSTIAYHCIGR